MNSSNPGSPGDFDDQSSISPELEAAIDASVYQAMQQVAPRMIALLCELRSAGATWADIELRIATWPNVAGEGDMRLWLDSVLRHMARQEQAQTVQGIWFADDPASLPDLGGECEQCGARVAGGARLCDVCSDLE